jgi:hypothetical protein
MKSFVGDVGPTLIMQSTDITQLIETYTQANSGGRVRSGDCEVDSMVCVRANDLEPDLNRNVNGFHWVGCHILFHDS